MVKGSKPRRENGRRVKSETRPWCRVFALYPENVYCTFRTRAFKNFLRFVRCRVKSELTEARCSCSTSWRYSRVVTDYTTVTTTHHPLNRRPLHPCVSYLPPWPTTPPAKLSFNTSNHAPAALGSDKSDKVYVLIYIYMYMLCRYIIYTQPYLRNNNNTKNTCWRLVKIYTVYFSFIKL